VTADTHAIPFGRILVTGGCGFIGSNLVRHLLGRWPELEVTNLDALTYAGNPENLAELEGDPRYRFVHGRVEDASTCEEALQGVDAVVHLAAETHVDRSILGPQIFIATNVLGTQVLLDCAMARQVKRVVYVGTDEVYGSAPDGTLFDEQAPFRPSSPYAASKAAADLLALAYHRTFGLDVVVTRCTNNYGPFQFPEKLIPLAIINAVEDQPIPVYGDGRQVRDWLHVEDHCRAICAVLARGRAGTAYNVAGDCRRENLELVTAVLERIGKPRSLIHHVADRPGHDRRYALATDRIQRELGWQPGRGLDPGLEQTIAWYLDHREWWQRVRDGTYRHYYREQYGKRLEDAQPRGEDDQ
jgi:dTDP-glucose 4,6-dehydratase